MNKYTILLLENILSILAVIFDSEQALWVAYQGSLLIDKMKARSCILSFTSTKIEMPNAYSVSLESSDAYLRTFGRPTVSCFMLLL